MFYCFVYSDLVFREQALKKRLALVQDSLNTALSDSSSHRRDNGEQIARLTQAHRSIPHVKEFVFLETHLQNH